jgi:hypothetical protein
MRYARCTKCNKVVSWFDSKVQVVGLVVAGTREFESLMCVCVWGSNKGCGGTVSYVW